MTSVRRSDHDAGPVLVLGGTLEGRQVAAALAQEGIPVLSSLAGRLADPLLPPGEVRIGGFGGIPGLVDVLSVRGISAVVDATHPFAAQMTQHAATACALTGTPLVRLTRPSWIDRPDAVAWHWVDELSDARAVAEELGSRVFLTVGRQNLHRFASWYDRYVLARVLARPEWSVPGPWEMVCSRGPFRLADELDLMRSRRIDALVTKDSGGTTTAKLDAAATLGVAVVVVRRPPLPLGLDTVASVPGALAWVAGQHPQRV